MTAETPGQAADAFAVWAEANGYGNEFAREMGYREMRQAFEAGKLDAAPEPKPARADEFARMKVKLSALVASMEDTVRPRPGDLYDSMSHEFDDGAVHATAVTLRQLRAILDETALTAGEPQPAPELAVADWTVDPATGRTNASPAFRAAVQAVDWLLRGGAGGAVLHESWTSGTAALIVAQLAHVHHLAPPAIAGLMS